jgi:hypothetical protein
VTPQPWRRCFHVEATFDFIRVSSGAWIAIVAFFVGSAGRGRRRRGGDLTGQSVFWAVFIEVADEVSANASRAIVGARRRRFGGVADEITAIAIIAGVCPFRETIAKKVSADTAIEGKGGHGPSRRANSISIHVRRLGEGGKAEDQPPCQSDEDYGPKNSARFTNFHFFILVLHSN